MKKVNYRILTLIFIFVSFLCAVIPVNSKEVDRLVVKGTSLVNRKGDAVVLRGVSFGWHNWWPRFYNAAAVRTLKEEWNCTLVRAAMGVEPEGAYLSDQVMAKKCITEVADAAIENGIYVIIDWHSHGIHTKEAKSFFREMATRYKGIPNVIYEVFNEPVEDSWEDVKKYAEEVIKTIREIDKEALILVGTPHWDQDIHLAADNPIKGVDNIMYTLHFYAATHGKLLRNRADYAIKKGLPVFVSECAGMEASGDGPIDMEEWNKWLVWMSKNNISWAAWSVADKDETCSMFYPSAPDHNWKESDIKEWGRIVKSVLADKRF